MNFKELLNKFVGITKAYIKYYEQLKELTGSERKKLLDKKMKEFLEKFLNEVPMNFILKFIVKNYIIKNIPAITQAIFDLIKSRIAGITEKA